MQNFIRTLVLWMLILIAFIQPLKAQQADYQEDLRIIVTLLDYVSKDYKMAVENGKIIDDAEYEEQIDFLKKCISVHEEIENKIKLPAFAEQYPQLKNLLSDIEQKADVQQVAVQALKIKNDLLDLGLLKISPGQWPLVNNGKILYQKHCTSCHGDAGGGDGPLAADLDPEPTSFLDEEDMSVLSPLQAYNVIKLGVEGTGMASYDAILSEQEVWDLSFYLMSLRHDSSQRLKEIPKDIILDDVAKWTDNELEKYLKEHLPSISIDGIRTFIPDRPHPLTVASTYLNKSLQTFKEGDLKLAENQALHSYLEGIELVENMLPRSLVREIESDMIQYRKAIKKGDQQKVEKYFQLLTKEIAESENYLSEVDYSFAFVYGASLSILLRESLEALLIILIVLSVLRPMNISKAIRAVHIGWITAVLLGFVSWFFVDKLIGMSGASRELMEGLGALIAVIVLLYAGTWLHSHSEVSKWTKFVKEKVSTVSESGSWMGLGVFSFIVVFREAFEVVLFLSSINLNATEDSSSALMWALITTIVLIVIIAYLFKKSTKKLPIGKIFKISAFVIAVLAVVLAGKGIHALQEAGYIGTNLITGLPQIEILGIYPSVQVLIAQLVVIAILVLFNIKNKQAAKTKLHKTN